MTDKQLNNLISGIEGAAFAVCFALIHPIAAASIVILLIFYSIEKKKRENENENTL